MCLDERREVLARLERRDGEHVRTPEVVALAVRGEGSVDARVGDVDALARDAERLGDVVAGEARVDDHDVARARRVRVLRRVHAPRPRVHPLGEVHRHEIVDHRRADAGPLRRVHPVAEVEHVEVADDALRRRPAEPAPGRPHRMRGGQDGQPALDGDPVERPLDLPLSLPARRRERDEVVPAGLGEAEERAADVVADAGARMRERRDVDDDPHPAAGTYSNPEARMPSVRGSLGALRTGVMSKRMLQVPACGSRWTTIVLEAADGRRTTKGAVLPDTAMLWVKPALLRTGTVSDPPVHACRVHWTCGAVHVSPYQPLIDGRRPQQPVDAIHRHLHAPDPRRPASRRSARRGRPGRTARARAWPSGRGGARSIAGPSAAARPGPR